MSDDNNTTAVNLTDSQGGPHDDANQLAGALETTAYNWQRRPGRPLDDRLLLGVGAAATRTRGRAAG